jgi:hypothetical protein
MHRKERLTRRVFRRILPSMRKGEEETEHA